MSLEDHTRRSIEIDDRLYPADSLRIVDAEVVDEDVDDDDDYCLLWDGDERSGWDATKYDMDESNGWWITRHVIPDAVFEEYYEPQNDLPSEGQWQMELSVDISHTPYTLYRDEDYEMGFWIGHEELDDLHYVDSGEFEALKEMVGRRS